MVENIKSHGILGIDVDTSKLTNSVKSVEHYVGLLKGYEASIRLKESSQPLYFQARKVPVHMLSLVVAKLNKMM